MVQSCESSKRECERQIEESRGKRCRCGYGWQKRAREKQPDA